MALTIIVVVAVLVLFEVLTTLLCFIAFKPVDHVALKDGRKLYWSKLPRDMRYLGRREDWHDGPISCLGLWWLHFYVVA